MSYEFDSARPIYLQMAELMIQAIASGGYAPGQKLPGVRELGMQYGVNPNTVQRTMADLERLGLVFSERTAGRFVTENRELIARMRKEAALAQAEGFLQQMKKLGYSWEETRELLEEKIRQEGDV